MDISINDVRFSYEGASPVLDGITDNLVSFLPVGNLGGYGDGGTEISDSHRDVEIVLPAAFKEDV